MVRLLDIPDFPAPREPRKVKEPEIAVKFSGYRRQDRPEAVRYAIKDCQETLAIWRDRPLDDPYVAKLYREFDALVAYAATFRNTETRRA